MAAIIEAVQEQGLVVMELLDPSQQDIADVLSRFGLPYLEFIAAPATLAVTRAAVADGAHVAVGAQLYASGPKQGWEGMRDYLARL